MNVFRKILILFTAILFIYLNYSFANNKSGLLELSNINKEFQITSLMNSAIANDYKAAEIFIASGANVNQKNIAGVSALHLAARNNSYETAEILLNSGANVNDRDNDGWTPLMRASLAGDSKMMQLLIQYGANIWDQNGYGETALLHTAMADCYECGKIILDNTISNNYLVNTQIDRSLQMAKKRYNKPFMELLKNRLNGSTNLTLNIKQQTNDENYDNNKYKADTTDESLVKLVYVFTGKKISEKDIQQIARNNYNYSLANSKESKNINDNKTSDNKTNADKIFNFSGEKSLKQNDDNKIQSVEQHKNNKETGKNNIGYNFTGGKSKLNTIVEEEETIPDIKYNFKPSNSFIDKGNEKEYILQSPKKDNNLDNNSEYKLINNQ